MFLESPIHNSLKLERTSVFITKGVDKPNVIFHTIEN